MRDGAAAVDLDESAPLPAVAAARWSSVSLAALWPNYPPAYASDALGLDADVASVGGGRGVVAARFAPAGTLLLVEAQLVATADGDLGRALARLCLGDASARAAVARLHPTAAADAAVDRTRLAEVVRRNGFASGVYLYRSLFNDSEDANCAPLVDGEGGGSAEIWTRRAVRAGEPLTLSYAGDGGCRDRVAAAHGVPREERDGDPTLAKIARALPILEGRLVRLAVKRDADLDRSFEGIDGPRKVGLAVARHRRHAAALVADANFVAARARAAPDVDLAVRALALAGQVHALAAEVFDGDVAAARRGDALASAVDRLAALERDDPRIAAAAGAGADALGALVAGGRGDVAAARLAGGPFAVDGGDARALVDLALLLRSAEARSAGLYDAARWPVGAPPLPA